MRYLRPAFALVAVVATSCGGTVATREDTAPTVTATAPTVTVVTPTVTAAGPSTPATSAAVATAVSSVVPDVSVVEVSSGRSVGLRGAAATDRPTLIWMWAPH